MSPEPVACFDWPTTITAVKDGVLALAAVATAVVAFFGLTRWRKELRGKAGFETARALARAVYRLRNEISDFRAPIVDGGEFPSSYSSKVKHTTAEEAEGWRHVLSSRWRHVVDAAADFDAQTLEAEALLGPEVREKAEALRRCMRELRVAVSEFLEDKNRGGEDFENNKEHARKVRSTLWRTGTDDDNEFSKRIAQCIFELERFLKPHLAKR